MRSVALLGLGLIALAFSVACGGGGGYGSGASTPATPAATAAEEAASNDLLPSASELGEAPVFWRTADGFASLRPNTPYKVVLRVTNNYAGETLVVTAGEEGTDQAVVFDAVRASPTGPDAPGAFYVFELVLPRPGRWRLTASAPPDQTSISLVVRPLGWNPTRAPTP